MGVKIKGGYQAELIDSILVDKYFYKVEEPVSEKWIFFDTFDWRLFNKSLTLHQSGQQLTLRRLTYGDSIESIKWTSRPVFAWDFPDGSFRKRLESITQARAVLMLGEVHTQSRTYRVLNTDLKTVARLVYTQVWSQPDINSPLLGEYIILQPVRGYPRYEQQLTKELEEIGHTTSIIEDIYTSAIKKSRIKPGSYSPKLGLRFDPSMRSDEAMKTIFLRLLKIMRANEAGITADVDTEFLHDYRIAIRRTRSALSQTKNVFPRDITNRFKRDFASMGQISNSLRDLDVYLLSEGSYRLMLPEVMKDDIHPLFIYLQGQRTLALKDVIRYLESEDYLQILQRWEVFIDNSKSDIYDEINSALPVIDLARKQIYTQYRRVVRDGNYILEHTQDELLHLLRIESKKLRYLMEIFAGLFPRKKITRLIKQLKILQDNLGEFNDLAVQQEQLLEFASEIPVSDKPSKMALVATGYLVETMARRQRIVKAGFAKTFTTFSSKNNQGLYRELFKYIDSGSDS